MYKLAILGASGHGKVVADTALQAGWKEVVFFDDGWPDILSLGIFPVLGGTEQLINEAATFTGILVAIGNNRIRLKKTIQLDDAGLPLVSVQHPQAYVAKDVNIAIGTVVFAGAVIQPGTSMGRASIVNTGATVDHDCVLSDGVHVCPGVHLAGDVVVGECTWLGIGSNIKQSIKIAPDVTVGAGAVVISNISEGETVVGIPARTIQKS